MKKLLLVATVLVSGVALSQAGINLTIGIGLPLPPLPPLPRPAVVIRQPAVVYAPPVCPPRVIISCPPPVCYEPAYERHDHRRGYDRWDRRDHGRNHWR